MRKHHQHVSINCNRLTLDLACSFALSNISCVTLLKAFTAQGLENDEASEIEIQPCPCPCPCHCPSPLPFPKPCARLGLSRCSTKHQLPQCCRMQKRCPCQGQRGTLHEHGRPPSQSRPRKNGIPFLPCVDASVGCWSGATKTTRLLKTRRHRLKATRHERTQATTQATTQRQRAC